MPITYTRPVTGTQLLSGIVGTVDVGSMIQKVAEIQREIDNTQQILTAIYGFIDSLPSGMFRTWQESASKDFEYVKDSMKELLLSALKTNAGLVRDQAIQSALGFGATANMISLKNKLVSTYMGLSEITDMLIGIPQTITLRKAERYWNKQLAPEYPNERDAFQLYRLGLWTKTQYVNMLREVNGLKPSDAEAITEIREWQTGKPSLRDAWYFVQKGYKSTQYFYDLATKGFGWTKEDADALYRHYFYDPSFSELLRLSDLIPLESSWIDKKLTALGLDSEDKTVFKTALEKRTVRDEINKAWSIILDCYQWGLFTEKDITDLLSNWKFTQEEINIRIQTGELLKTKLRVKLLRDAEIYLFRNGQITANELLVRLTNLGISKDIANAIVRYECAKQGFEWEIPSE